MNEQDELPPNHTVWFDNICAHRHEVVETWNLMYLTDEQAKACYVALSNIEHNRQNKERIEGA